MKKLILASILTLSSSLVFASNSGGFSETNETSASTSPSMPQGGFQGPSRVKVQTVVDAKKAKDDTKITLKGYFVESLGNENYTFKDETGSLVVEVEHDDWHGITVLPTTKVMISGEVDVEHGEKQIEVDHIQLIK